MSSVTSVSGGTTRIAPTVAGGMWLVSLAVATAGVYVLAISFDVPRPEGAWGTRGFGMVVGVAFATVGALIARRRPGNAVGWLYLVTGLLLSTVGLADEWAQYVLLGDGAGLPLGEWGAWMTDWVWIVVLGMALVYAVLLFPDGRFPTTAARRLGIVTGPVVVAVTVIQALGDFRIQGIDIDNPAGVLPISRETAETFISLVVVLIVAAQVVLIRRLRRARGDEREQIRWVVMAEAFAGLALASNLPAVMVEPAWWTEIPEILSILGLLSIPVAAGVAILRQGLYGIETVISRGVVAAGLTLFVTLVYAAVVGGVGALLQRGDEPNHLLAIGATIVVALAFQPVRDRLRRVADRVAYGERAEPYEVLAELSERLRTDPEPDDVLRQLARSLTQGTSAASTVVWLRVRDELRPAAVWPADVDEPEPVALDASSAFDDLPIPGDRREPVVHGDELLGAITLTKRYAEPLPSDADRLVRDVAAHAGLVLRNLRLTAELEERVEELRESRQRLVAAQDAERRRIERDLHDGAQQQLVALKVQLSLARLGAEESGATDLAATIDEVSRDLGGAIETLRELAHGIYPPRLAADGLVHALRGRAGACPFELDVEAAPDVGRYPPEVEAAVYFCCLEALQNAAKYASASRVVVELGATDHSLSFAVIDDGAGFDVDSTPAGAGTTNMRDRVEALGGELAFTSTPGTGTTVAGRVPIGDE